MELPDPKFQEIKLIKKEIKFHKIALEIIESNLSLDTKYYLLSLHKKTIKKGRGRPRNKSKPWNDFEKYSEVACLKIAGSSQNKACKKVGVSNKSFREYKKDFEATNFIKSDKLLYTEKMMCYIKLELEDE